jgi:hypothetical protein
LRINFAINGRPIAPLAPATKTFIALSSSFRQNKNRRSLFLYKKSQARSCSTAAHGVHVFRTLVERHNRSKCHFLPGWYSPGTKRNVIASRFHPLMVMIAGVRFTNSSSEKLFFAVSYSASGTWPSLTRVIASVSAYAVRSRAVKNGVSSHAESA